MSNPVTSAAPSVAPTPMPESPQQEEVKQSETAQAANDAANETFQENNSSGTQSASNSSMLERAWTTVTDGVKGLSASISNGASRVQNFVLDQASNGAHLVSYDHLNQVGGNIISGITNSLPVTKSQEWISKGANFVEENAPGASNWLPVAVAAASVCASAKSIQAGVQSVNVKDYKRAAYQIFAGASAALLAGSIAYQTPAAQSFKARFTN